MAGFIQLLATCGKDAKKHAALPQGEGVFAAFLEPQTESQVRRPTMVARR
jgi:hypothetical protein